MKSHKKCTWYLGLGYTIKKVTRYVSHEMAIESGNLDYEGQPIGDEYIQIYCERCKGTGYIKTEVMVE